MEADGVVDGRADLVAYFHVFGGEPAADAVVLEIGVEATGEGVVY